MSASTLGKRKTAEPTCKFGPCIVSEEHMNTYMRDESGNNPMITCENIPEEWKSWGGYVENGNSNRFRIRYNRNQNHSSKTTIVYENR